MRLHALAAGGEEGRDHAACSTSARKRHGIAQRQPRRRPAGLEPARGSSARSTCARHSACATGSSRLAAMSSATAVAGRCGAPLTRSSRRKPSLIGRQAQAQQRHRRDGGDEHEQRRRPMARPSGGSTSQRPTQENARNKPTAVARVASAGHSRSHNRLPRARVSARASSSRVAGRSRGWSSSSSKGRSVTGLSGRISHDNTLARGHFRGHAICASNARASHARRAISTLALPALKPGRQPVERDQCVDFEARPHHAPIRRRRTSTSGTSGRVL